MSHIVFTSAGTSTSLRQQPWHNETELCTALRDHPELVVRHGESPPFVLGTEVQLPGAGRLDLLLLDRLGRVTVVEAKLERNAEHRREVLSQVMDYAETLSKATPEHLDRLTGGRLSRHVHENSRTQELALAWLRSIGDGLREHGPRIVVATDHVAEQVLSKLRFLCARGKLDARVVTVQRWSSDDSVGQLFAADVTSMTTDGDLSVGPGPAAERVAPIGPTQPSLLTRGGTTDPALYDAVQAYARTREPLAPSTRGEGWQCFAVPGFPRHDCTFGLMLAQVPHRAVVAHLDVKEPLRNVLDPVMRAVAATWKAKSPDLAIDILESKGRLRLQVHPVDDIRSEVVASAMSRLVSELTPPVASALRSAGRLTGAIG